jgi:hypothetical protein
MQGDLPVQSILSNRNARLTCRELQSIRGFAEGRKCLVDSIGDDAISDGTHRAGNLLPAALHALQIDTI